MAKAMSETREDILPPLRQLVVLTNLESFNAVPIRQELP